MLAIKFVVDCMLANTPSKLVRIALKNLQHSSLLIHTSCLQLCNKTYVEVTVLWTLLTKFDW